MTEFSVYRLTNNKKPGVFLLSYSSKGLKGVRATVRNYYIQYTVYLKKLSLGESLMTFDFYKLFDEQTTTNDIEITLEKTFKTEVEAEAYKKSVIGNGNTDTISTVNTENHPQKPTNWETVKAFLQSEIEMLGCDISFASNEVQNLEDKLQIAKKQMDFLINRREDIIKLVAVCQPHSVLNHTLEQ